MSGVNETMAKFGYPQSCLAEYDHWVVLLRPQQVTLGALILACREEATAFAQIRRFWARRSDIGSSTT